MSQETEFHIDNENAANWFLRKLANIEAEKQRVKAQAAAIADQLDRDAESLNYLYKAEFEAYARKRIEAGKRRSVTFLQGTASLRTVKGRLSVEDDTAALDYAAAHAPELVTTVQNLDKREYLRRAEQTGELLPGIQQGKDEEKFSITFGKIEA